MKKIMMLAFGILCLKVQAQKSKDSVIKNIELPAAKVQAQRPSILGSDRTKCYLGDPHPNLGARLNQVQDLPYILNSLSGVVVSSDAGTGTGYTDIKVRGTDLTRINVTMNGVPVNDPESQATYFVNTPDLLSSTSEIDIQKGVGSSKNGTGNFGAAIAINNLDVQNKNAYIKYNIDFGSFNTLKNTLKVSSGLLNNKFIGTLRISSILSDGYVERSSSDLKGIQFTGKYVIDSSTQFVFNYLKGKEKTGQAWNGVLEDSLKTQRRYNELGLMRNGDFYKNQTDNYGQDYYQLFFDKSLNKHVDIGTTLFYTKGAGYYEEYKLDQEYSAYGLPNKVIGADTITSSDMVRQLWLDNDYYGGRIYATYVSNKLDAGLYLNYNEYKGRHHGDVIWAYFPYEKDYRWYDLNAQKKDLNVYGMFDYKWSKKISFLADAQIRKVDYTLNGFRNNPSLKHEMKYFFFNPKVSFKYTEQNYIVEVVSGLANKEPNRDDIEAGANNLPKPESMWDNELYFIYGKKRWKFQATIYSMQYKNQLVLTGKINDVGAYTRSNIDYSFRRGLELEGSWQSIHKEVKIELNVAISQNKIKNFTEYIDDYDAGVQLENKYASTDISFSPSIVAGGVISIFPFWNKRLSIIKEFSIDVLPKYVGKQYLDNTSNEKRSIKPYFVNDVMFHCPIHVKNKQTLTARLGVYNIFNSLYEVRGYTYSYKYDGVLSTFNYYYPQARLRWMLGLGINL
jgi:iron complex outermembrane recepter protein